MRGLDYHWLAALDAIVQSGCFELAAKKLCISQSAISQRVKQLERWLCQPALIRSNPPQATVAGARLLGLYRQVRALEQDTMPELFFTEQATTHTLSIATNADSLDTWLLLALKPLLESNPIELNLVIEDENRTLEKLLSGEVIGALSIISKPLPNCEATFIGKMEYILAASPCFIERYFSEGLSNQAFSQAPEVLYEPLDRMNERFVDKHFGPIIKQSAKHTLRNSQACLNMVEQGLGYCTLPKLQIEGALSNGTIIDLMPGQTVDNDLYWHHWPASHGLLKELTSCLVNYGKQHL